MPVIEAGHWFLMTFDLLENKIFHYNSMRIKADHRKAFSTCLSTVKLLLKPLFPDKKWGKTIEAKGFPQQEG